MGKERPRVVPQTIHKLRPFVLPAAPGDPPVDKPRVCPSSGDGRCSLSLAALQGVSQTLRELRDAESSTYIPRQVLLSTHLTRAVGSFLPAPSTTVGGIPPYSPTTNTRVPPSNGTPSGGCPGCWKEGCPLGQEDLTLREAQGTGGSHPDCLSTGLCGCG